MLGKIIMTIKFLSALPAVAPMVKESWKLSETEYFHFRRAAEQEWEERLSESVHLDFEQASFYKNNTLSILNWTRFARAKFTSFEVQEGELNELIAVAKENIKNVEENTILAEKKRFKERLIELKERLGEADYKLIQDFRSSLKECARAEDGSENKQKKLDESKAKVKEIQEKLGGTGKIARQEFREIHQTQIRLIKNSEEIAEYKKEKQDWQNILRESELKLKSLSDAIVAEDQNIKKIPGAWPGSTI
ncbi:MAG: hypothetical protein MRERV_64c004 [Mycoplasmataceae bacterium RV_VA103A]|nr:MAG: hypothetical protein MRERV_64c004 [Mycoplasmataceae bacterium RV_VA103A]